MTRPVLPVFTWLVDEGSSYTDGRIETVPRRKLVLDEAGWEWLLEQVSDRTAFLLLEMARLSVLDPARGRRVVALGQEELRRRVGRGRHGWGEGAMREMIRGLVSAGLLTEIAVVPLGPQGGSLPKMFVLENGLFTGAAEHGPALVESYKRRPSRPPANRGSGSEPSVNAPPAPAGPVIAEPSTSDVPAGQLTPRSPSSRVGAGSYGSMDDCSPTIHHPAATADPAVATVLSARLRELGFGDAPRIVAGNDPAWLASWLDAVALMPGVGNKGGYLRALVDPDRRAAVPTDPPGWVPGTTVAVADGTLRTTRPARPAPAPAAADPVADLEVLALSHHLTRTEGDLNPDQVRLWRLNARLRAGALADLRAQTGMDLHAYLATHLPDLLADTPH